MDERGLRRVLSGLPLGGWRYVARADSTNDVALAWAAEGAADLSLVYAEEQTAGRGRENRRWVSLPGTGMTFSLILRPGAAENQTIPLFSGLGALAVCKALEALGLHPEIKWPNDVLLNRKKVCGILAEAVWLGEKADRVVLGIGVNVNTGAIPPADQLNFPAACIEDELALVRKGGEKSPVDHHDLLRNILQGLLYWRDLMATDEFLQAWESRLAFRQEQVEVGAPGREVKVGSVEGLEKDGSLRLRSGQGEIFTVPFGEIRLRPVV